MNAINYVLEHIEGIFLVISLLISGILIVLKFFDIQSKSSRRRMLKEEFDAAIRQLSSNSETHKLAAAILIRRFFTAEKGFYRNEAIYVLSSLLRVVPTGIFQKTLADGLAYGHDLSKVDLQKTNLQDAYIGFKEQLTTDMREADLFKADLSNALIERIDGRIYTQLGNLTAEHRSGIEEVECRGGSRVGQVVGRHINSLHRGN